MKFKKIIYILIVIVVGLIIVAGISMYFNADENNIQTEKVSRGNVSIVVTGDVMFARKMSGVLGRDSNPFKGVDNVTSKTDLLLINFENAVTDSVLAVKGDVPLKTSANYVHLAKDNNNTIAALANNHAFDYGIKGMHDTVDALQDNGIEVIGAGDDAEKAHSPVTHEINGYKITIFNYMDSENFKEYSQDVMPKSSDNTPGYSAMIVKLLKKIYEKLEIMDQI